MRHVATLRARCSRVGADSGFTLIELMVTMAILLVVVTSLTGALISATNSQADLNNRFQTQQQARLALTKLTREVHCANTIQDSTGGTLTSTPPGATGIVVTLPAGCPTGGASAVTVRWCTVADGATWDLYRWSNAACNSTGSGGVRWASSLVSSTPFTLSTPVSTRDFPLVHIELKVNTRISPTHGTYDLVGDAAALNFARPTS